MSGIEVALGKNVTEQEGGIMDGFKGKCKFTCFRCGIAWEGKSDEKDIEYCPECGRESSLIESITDAWTLISECKQPYKVFSVAHHDDLYPISAFFIIGQDGSKIWLRESEGPEDGGPEDYAKTGRYTELLRPPTHFMDLPEMPMWAARVECKDCYFYQQGPLFEPDFDKCTNSVRSVLNENICAGFWDGASEL